MTKMTEGISKSKETNLILKVVNYNNMRSQKLPNDDNSEHNKNNYAS